MHAEGREQGEDACLLQGVEVFREQRKVHLYEWVARLERALDAHSFCSPGLPSSHVQISLAALWLLQPTPNCVP